jgi:biopolymer transport protein ExbB/TolQ
MKKIKINKALIASLITSSLIVSSLAVNQTIAWSAYSIASLTSSNTYSEEVELNSAPEYSEKIMKMKSKYYDIFSYKIANSLKSQSTENLEKIIDKIDKAIKNAKENAKISMEKQEKILAQLLALKEIIEKALNESYEYSIDIDLEELLKV